MRTIEASVAQQNQEALTLMCEGHEVQAKQIFHACLNQAQQRKQSEFPGSSRSSISPRPVPLMGALGPEDDWNGYQGQYFQFYRNVFTVNNIGAHIWDSATYSLFCAMVSYNLAIMYHHEGIVEGEITAMGMARTLYYTAMESFTNCRVGNDAGILLLGLALYNNLGFFNARVGDTEGMQQCRQLMETALAGNPSLDQESEAFFRSSMAWTEKKGSVSTAA